MGRQEKTPKKQVSKTAQDRGQNFSHSQIFFSCDYYSTFFSILQVAKNMGSVVKSLEKAVNSMELQKITEVMDKFESQFEDLDVHTSVSRIHTPQK
jgi:capsular polysaccharide biosynthesis protein